MRNNKPLKSQTAEIQTANGIRRRLLEASRNNSLIRAVFDMAQREGLSGEDTYALLAYHALVAKEEMEQQAIDALNSRPNPPFLACAAQPEEPGE